MTKAKHDSELTAYPKTQKIQVNPNAFVTHEKGENNERLSRRVSHIFGWDLNINVLTSSGPKRRVLRVIRHCT